MKDKEIEDFYKDLYLDAPPRKPTIIFMGVNTRIAWDKIISEQYNKYYMKPLPILLRLPNDEEIEYFCGIDVAYDKDKTREVFTFCVLVKIDDNTIRVVQQGDIINEYKNKIDSPVRDYCRALSKFYNCAIIIGK